jgi:ketosteroid isomerase-like protein
MLNPVTSDFEWFPAFAGTVEGGSFKGREGIETYLGELRDTWDEFRVVCDDFRDLGDHALVLVRVEARGRSSSVPVTRREALIFDFRHGKISRCRDFLDHGEALRAAGLAE